MSEAWELGAGLMMDLAVLELVRVTEQQDAATKKIRPEHGFLDLTDICALARLLQGLG